MAESDEDVADGSVLYRQLLMRLALFRLRLGAARRFMDTRSATVEAAGGVSPIGAWIVTAQPDACHSKDEPAGRDRLLHAKQVCDAGHIKEKNA
jgi:hypothetical protein